MAGGIHPGFHNFLLGLEAEGDVFRFTGIRETGVSISAPAVLAVGTGVAEVLGDFLSAYHGDPFPQIFTGGQRSGTDLGTFRVHQGQDQDVGLPGAGGVGFLDFAADLDAGGGALFGEFLTEHEAVQSLLTGDGVVQLLDPVGLAGGVSFTAHDGAIQHINEFFVAGQRVLVLRTEYESAGNRGSGVAVGQGLAPVFQACRFRQS